MTPSTTSSIAEHAQLLDQRLEQLSARGVDILDPRQTHVAVDVELERIEAGCVLFPGTRISGAKTLIASGARVGSEGPTTVVDAQLAPGSQIASGYVEGAVLLEGASAGANAHLRPGTLLEEEASTAHCVGLKQSILMSFVTLGSLINFCDCLMSGGTSRKDHSEVGSGYIHFNFTPWGERGDKATPSMMGDVVSGVFLDRARIFLGGTSGMVGPAQVGFGSVTAAGQVLRRDVGEDRMVGCASRAIDREFRRGAVDGIRVRAAKNLAYIAQLHVLAAWYREVRIERARRHADAGHLGVLQAVPSLIEAAIAERIKQFDRFLLERGVDKLCLDLPELPRCPWSDGGDSPLARAGEHVGWVQGLSADERQSGHVWLESIARAVHDAAPELNADAGD